jgi:hypothetical protein
VSVRMRFREDSITAAEYHARELRGNPVTPHECDDPACEWNPEAYRKIPPAEPGDTWRLTHWRKEGNGPTAGYAICCPRCRQVHYWASANNCASKRQLESGGRVCDHTGKSSCWDWGGSAEEGTLTGSPSLFANGEGACGWHGYLRAGALEEC